MASMPWRRGAWRDHWSCLIRSITLVRSDWDSVPYYQRGPNGGLEIPIRKIKLDGIDFCVYHFI